ncbi:MAG: hypothetical protein HQL54_02715 [Magnetococcales bacterium]|nr:hypothetical protein [Magnetococcales bacterium]
MSTTINPVKRTDSSNEMTDSANTDNQNGLDIVMGENCYDVYDKVDNKAVIEGITTWETACEVHEMLAGERDS